MLLTGSDEPMQATDGRYPHDKAKLDYDKIFQEFEAICPSMASTIEYMRSIVPAKCGESRICFKEIFNHTENEDAARKRLFEMCMRMAARNALYYHKQYHIDIEELFQICCEGIMIAIDKYKTEYLKNSFPTYVWYVIVQQINANYPITKKRKPKQKDRICQTGVPHDAINDALDNVYINQVLTDLWKISEGKLKVYDKEAIIYRLARFGLSDESCTTEYTTDPFGTDKIAFKKQYYTIQEKLSRMAIKNGLLNEIVPSITERKRIFFIYHRRTKPGPKD